jgi:hypothetical protein
MRREFIRADYGAGYADRCRVVCGRAHPGCSVLALCRCPVKSMMGEELNSSVVPDRVLLSDRQFAVVDRVTGKVRGARSEEVGQLL